MRRFVERYGFILGYVALATLLAAAIRYLIWRQMDVWTKGLLICGAVTGVLFIVAHWDQVRAALTRRSTRYSSNAVVMSIAFVGIVILLNVLAGRYHYRYDATELKEHTLSPQSIQVLAELDRPITIVGFFRGSDPQQASFEDLLNQYLSRSDKLSYTAIDPDREPLIANQYPDFPDSGLLLQSDSRNETVYVADEQNITSAILKVSREEKPVIYFLTGHQEHPLEGFDNDGYSTVADELRNDNYDVRTLSLAITTTVPGDAAAIVIAGPQTEFLPEELTQLQQYLAAGGKALIMQDPLYEAGLNDVLAGWLVRFGDGIVIDPASSLMTSVAIPAVTSFGYSQVTQGMDGLVAFFPLARPVEQTGQDSSGLLAFTSLVETTSQSWAELDTQQIAFDAGVDTPGPLTLAATVESPPAATGADPNAKTRIVLVGNSVFAANSAADNLGNTTLFLNVVNWLAEEENLIAIGPKSTQPRTVYLSGVQASAILVGGAVLIPLALLIVGVVVWWQRR